MAIFGLLSIAAYTVLDSGMRSKQQAEIRLEHLAQLQRFFHTLNQDLQYYAPRQTRNEFGDKAALLSGSSDLSGEVFDLSFSRSRWRNPAGFPRSHLQNVQYRLEDKQVIRRHWVFLDKSSNSSHVDRLMAKDIEAVRLQFKVDETLWVDQWGQFGNELTRLPIAIKVQVTSAMLGEIERYYLLTQYGAIEAGE